MKIQEDQTLLWVHAAGVEALIASSVTFSSDGSDNHLVVVRNLSLPPLAH